MLEPLLLETLEKWLDVEIEEILHDIGSCVTVEDNVVNVRHLPQIRRPRQLKRDRLSGQSSD